MPIIDIIGLCLAAGVLLVLALLLARQRFMLRSPGSVPVALRGRGDRWLYGVARYAGNEFRWFRSLGLGTRPSRVLRREQLHIVSRRWPSEAERSALPPTAVIVECSEAGRITVIALGEGAFTGFSSWLEAAAPLP